MQGRRFSWLLLGLCTAAVGCLDDPEEEGRAVRVKSVQRHVMPGEAKEVPWDSSAPPLEMFRLEGENYVPVAGTVDAEGRSVFDDAPAGTYFLRRGASMVVTDAREVDLSTHTLGRPDVDSFTREPALDLSVNGLEPWVASESYPSELDFMSENVGAFAAMRTSAREGETAILDSAPGVQISLNMSTRFTGTKGDGAWILQRTPRVWETVQGGARVTYDSVGRALNTEHFTYEGSGPLRLTGTLKTLPMKELSLDWKVPSFMALASEVNPAAVGGRSSFYIFPAPHGLAHGAVGFSGWLLGMSTPAEPTQLTGRFVYGNPYPSSWPEVAAATVTFMVPLETSGEAPYSTRATLSVTGAPSALASGALLPLVQPPQKLMVDGQDASTARGFSSESVVLQWQAPARGTPNAYEVSVLSLTGASGSRSEKRVLSIAMDGGTTSVRIPKGTLVRDERYFFRVRAIQAPGYNAKGRPFIFTGNATSATADAVSGLLTFQ
ncbi:fibronectin type III domain-containing protein [Myxococcus stipitatus]|uniref:fibronectin type III domain-containing protein n=1 Tax=Myxococcus stipitatus TaxID=83455 RepID=UPI0030D065E0